MSSRTESPARSRHDVLAAIRAKWIAAGLSTTPADRSASEDAIRRLYALRRLRAPRIEWLASPLALFERTIAARTGAWRRASLGELHLDLQPAGLNWFAADVWEEANAIRDAVSARTWAPTGRVVGQMLADRVGAPGREWGGLLPGMLGLPTVPLLALAQALAAIQGTSADQPVVDEVERLALNAGWAYGLHGLAFVCERPQGIWLDDLGRLSRLDGPAMRYGDGFAIYAVAGQVVEPHVVTQPDQISIEEIDAQANTEVRRLMLQRFGYPRFLAETRARMAHEDDTGRLWQRRLANDTGWAMVEVVNGTPEPDGSHRHYFLQVPPWCASAREAVAWTYGLTADDYVLATRT